MALRETRGRQRRTVKESCSAEAILHSVQDSTDNAAGLCSQLNLYLAPLAAITSRKGAKDKENRQHVEEHSLAKQYLPFLVQLLKLCSSTLATSQAKIDTDAQKKADELFSAMALALDSLHQLRAWLTSCSHEIEIQRYRLVRLLITWKRHREALAQCWDIYRSLCTTILAGDKPVADSKVATSGKGRGKGRKVMSAGEAVGELRLPPPQPGQDSPSLPMLVTGVALDLLLCAAEDFSSSFHMMQTLASLPDDLDPWIGVLPSGGAQKQNDIMFKGLYKLALLLAQGPQNYESTIVYKICVGAIYRCASSCQGGQYVKVCRRLCCPLSIHAPKLAIRVCSASLNQLFHDEKELSLLSRSSEMLDLMECYARLCQTADCALEGSAEIQRILHPTDKNGCILQAVAGLYAVGLQLTDDESIQGNGGISSQFCDLFETAVETVHVLVDQEVTGLPGATSKFSGRDVQEKMTHDSSYWSQEKLMSVFKALDYVRKCSSSYIQSTWNAYVSSSCSATAASPESCALNKLLEQILHQLCLFADKNLSRAGVSDPEADVKTQRSVSAAALAALRLSFITDQRPEGHVPVLRNLLQRSPVDAEELRWLMSSTYNMGVQIFNAGKYNLACAPLRLAFEAACSRITAGQLISVGEVKSASPGYSGPVADVISKGVALVDALLRIGDLNEAVEVLIGGLCHWGTAHTLENNLPSPRQLIRLWVKVQTSTTKTPDLLVNLLCDIQPPLSSSTIGFLMQEEFSAYDAVENEHSRTKKEQILDILLRDVYVTEHDYHARSKVLLEKARMARCGGPESLSSCMLSLSEAVSILEHALTVSKRDSTSAELVKLLHQSAIVLCVRGLCAFEVNPSTQQFVEDFSRGTKCWREVLLLLNKPSSRPDSTADDPRSTSQCFFDILEQEAVGLLLDAADLAALKGYSELQDEIQDLVFDFAGVCRDTSANEMFKSLWAQRQLGHVLCCVPHSSNFSASLSKKFGIHADSFGAWKVYAKNCESSLLDARLRLIAEDLLRKGFLTRDDDGAWAVGADAVKQTASELTSKGPKTTQALLDLAGMYHALGQHACDNGNLVEAVAFSREALKLRLKCFNRAFPVSKRALIGTVYEAEPCSLASGVASNIQLDVAAHVATHAWPASHSAEKHELAPSQWRVLGDYLESLFQAGALQERSGSVDEAERDLVEGLHIANALHLRIPEAMFTSTLGEVFRKRHLWKQAADYLAKTEAIYCELDTKLSCRRCIQAGRTLLRVRVGDLLRHCSDANVLSTLVLESEMSPKSLDHALKNYLSAHEEVPRLMIESESSVSSMESWTILKWDQCGRRLKAQAFTQEGKTYCKLEKYSSAEQSFQESGVLLRRTESQNVFQCESPNSQNTAMFPLDEALLLYHTSKLRLRRDMAHGGTRLTWRSTFQQILLWLYRSFLLCHQVPPVLRKVANLLALLHVPTSSGGFCQHPGKGVAELHLLAAYFQQAALGASTRQQHLAIVNSKLAAIVADPDKSLHSSSRKRCLEDMQQALRTVPHESNEFAICGETLVKDLSGSCVCCICFVDEEHVFLLNQGQTSTTAWLFLTHLGSQAEPVVMILPAVPLTTGLCSPYYLEDNRRNQGDNCGEVMRNENMFLKRIIPEFSSIMEESRKSTVGIGPMTTTAQKSAWWKWRTDLDSRLSALLCAVEEHWLGPWKCFLLGRPSNVAIADAMEKSSKKLHKKLQSMLHLDEEAKLAVELDEKLVRLLLRGLSCLDSGQVEAGIAWIMGWRLPIPGGCRRSDRLPSKRKQLLSAAAEEFLSAYKASIEVDSDDAAAAGSHIGSRLRQKMRNRRPVKRVAAQRMESSEASSPKAEEQSLSRRPVQLVLDANLQVLPWESLPCVRQCEMYRMPSVGSIRALLRQQTYDGGLTGVNASPDLHVGKQCAEEGRRSVNASNSYYLLNPSGDLSSTQAAFEDWFASEEGWKGKTGQVPSVSEFMEGLLKHDLFIYFGHGSGEQYLSGRRIRRMDKCAAALLMGCGSGRLASRGEYDAVGIPLSYLIAGCPTVIANLWDVTDGDIDRFSRVLLHRWLGISEGRRESNEERTKQADAVLGLSGTVDGGSNERRASSEADITASLQHLTIVSRTATPSDLYMGRIAEGRTACKLPFLIGAAPVCYGVPTEIQVRSHS